MGVYEKNGIQYPSVTTVLDVIDKSGALMPWAAKLERVYVAKALHDGEFSMDSPYAYKSVQKEALSVGSEVHDMIEKYIKYGVEAVSDLREEVRNSFDAFREWEKESKVVWLESEMSVFSEKHCFAGCLDAVAIIDGKLYVVDFKTSKGFYAGYTKQISAYALAYTEMTGKKIEGCGVLRIDKETGLPEWKDCTKNRERKEEAFLKLLDFYYADKRRRLRGNPRVK